VEAAVDEGLRQLGVSRDQIEVEVVNEGSRGILGIGASDALVRLTRKPSAGAQESSSQDSSAVSTEAVAETAVGLDGPAEVVSLAPDVELPPPPDEAEAPEQVDESQPDFEDQEDEDDEELEGLAYDLLSEMLQNLGIEAEIELSWLDDPEDSDRPLNLNVVGDDLGILIGRNGETLASIQYLIRLMINQELHRWKNIVIDIDGYKQRRAEQLSQLAHRLADQVVASGRPVSMEPMPASERRLVHIALRNHEHVYTASTGEDNRRKVQILPK
jgi:spoIIIJ-associated protein